MSSKIASAYMRARGLTQKEAEAATALLMDRVAEVIESHGGLFTAQPDVMRRVERLTPGQYANVDLASLMPDLIRGVVEVAKSG